jgi:diguanylate cyclase (GGDEF)-like protein
MRRARFSVSLRFMLVLFIGIALQACISVGSLLALKQSQLSDRTSEVKHRLETAYSTVAFYESQARAGRLTDRAARTAAIDAVRAMRYADNDYFFIWALDGTGIAHGAHPEWEGKRFIDSPDARKYPIVSRMVSALIAVARSPAKEGVSTYRIPKLGGATPLEKITYSRLFAPWGWSIGTGAYVDDINAAFRQQALWLLAFFIGLTALAATITFALGRDLAVALTRLAARIDDVARGNFEGEVPETARTDEVGIIARALLVLRDNSQEAVALRLDQLTGLPNRKLLMDRLGQAMAANARSGQYAGLMFLDLDKFKVLNDTHGHDVGDMLLRQTAQRLRSCIRDSDTVARLGGDEFVIVVVDIGTTEQEAAATVKKIGAKARALLNEPFEFGTIRHVTTASIGLTLLGGNATSVEEVLKQADLAMYKAKESGRNACRFFDPHMEAVVRDRIVLEAELSAAIAQEQFALAFQPRFGSGDRLRGVEALIRWNHPQRGLVGPLKFIPFAEETGLIFPIGRWVLEAACKQIVAWANDAPTAQLKVAVNVSSRQFQQPDFVGGLFEILRETGADPHRLELEVTESLLIDDVDAVIAKMLPLRAVGVSFTLDDFGTGYSSFMYLKRIPLDRLKIDRAFVSDVLTDPNTAAIAQTIVALAHSLGFGVVAEGIESAEQRQYLASLGCDEYQGYYFSRPLAPEHFDRFVRRTTLNAGQRDHVEAT